MTTSTADFPLSVEELRAVAAFVAQSAEEVLAVVEHDVPDDRRPRSAIDAAWVFVNGAPRTRLQRVASFDAHRAAARSPTERGRLAAQAAGDAASAAYLHPITKAHQVGHILRAAANAARIAEIDSAGDPTAAAASLARACVRASPAVVDVLRRYPPAPPGRARPARLMRELDQQLRRRPAAASQP
ncbi:MAG: putative immunity protein [Dermatophilaceae bacterium]